MEPLLAGNPGKRTAPKTSFAAMTTNLITAGLGAGILSLPWSLAGASVGVGVALIAVGLLVNGWTLMILVEAAEEVQQFDLGALVARLPYRWLGSFMQAFMNVAVWISNFGTLIGEMIIVADAALDVMAFNGLDSEWLLGRRYFWVALSSACVLPLCYLDQQRLACSSTLSILVNIYVFGLIVAQFAAPGAVGAEPLEPPAAEQLCFLGLTKGAVTMFSAMTQSVAIQMCVLPMYKDMDRRSPARFRKALNISFGFIFILFTCFAVTAVMAVGPGVSSNVLLDLPSSHLSNVGRLGMLAVSASIYPFMVTPMVEPLEAWAGEGLKADKIVKVAKGAIVAAVMVAGCFVHSLGLMNVLNGALAVGVFVALAPSLVGSMLLKRPGSTAHQASMILLLFFGAVMMGIGLVYVDNYVSELTPETCVIGLDDVPS
mmetsp:Transcript_76653/g.165854  ORF Transcript_76653/g.165854 Transcript_76653/m.165854 type:complete len:430 (-) Transcript_76653:509-1798(-)